MRDDFWNLFPEVIFGREGDEGNNDEGTGDGDDVEDEGDPVDDDTNDQPKSTKTDEDFANLEKALKAERREGKAKERELNRLRAGQAQKQESENEDLETTKRDLLTEREKTQKLASGLLKRTVDAAIKDAARDLKFIDVEDAINGVDRSALVVDQDDEDPSDIDLDTDSVIAAVKKLAAKKPHFITKGTDDGSPTGSSMGGSRRRNSKVSEEEELRNLYPGL